jgi:hypothetical protein
MATGNSTSKRGFASMDEERQREIANVPSRRIGSLHPRQDGRVDRRLAAREAPRTDHLSSDTPGVAVATPFL